MHLFLWTTLWGNVPLDKYCTFITDWLHSTCKSKHICFKRS